MGFGMETPVCGVWYGDPCARGIITTRFDDSYHMPVVWASIRAVLYLLPL